MGTTSKVNLPAWFEVPTDGTISISGTYGHPGDSITVYNDARKASGVIASHASGRTVVQVESVTEQPMPAINPEGKIVLPRLLGHPHCRVWYQGDIVKLHGGYHKVTKAAANPTGSHSIYKLAPATEEQYQTRPVRVRLDDGGAHNIGRVMEATAGLMQVKKIERTVTRSAGIVSATYYGVGPLLKPDQVDKARTKDPHHVAAELKAAFSAETLVDALPAKTEEIWSWRGGTGSSATWFACTDGVLYFTRTNYDEAPRTWRTTATREQIERAQKLGVNANLSF